MTEQDSNATLLAYALVPSPDPLRVDGRAQLTLAVSNPQDDAVTCSQIVLTMPVGTAGTDLTDGKSAINAQPAEGWSATTSGGVITFTPPGGSIVIKGTGLAFLVAVTVNSQPGTATIRIDETASTSDDPSQVRSREISRGKFPADFSLSDLTSVPPDRLDIPYGKTATLMWSATGQNVSCTLSYQPTDDSTWVTKGVPNTGPITSVALTRSGGVLFTLTAQMNVLGQDQPLVAQKQLHLTNDTLSLTLDVQPPAVAPNGLVRLRWHAPNADHCTLEDGTVLPPSGGHLFVLQQSRRFVITAHGSGGAERQASAPVDVDPSITANQPAITVTGGPGAPGQWGLPDVGGPGGRGGDAVLNQLPPLDETSKPTRVIPIALTGGKGGDAGRAKGDGHRGGWGRFGRGGDGGNAGFDVSFDGPGDPAQYVVTLSSGSAGYGEPSGNQGSVLMTVRDAGPPRR